jgi:hypothetical protein
MASVVFRVLLGAGGVVAAVLGILWVVGIVSVLDPNFNTRRQVSSTELAGLAILGVAGVLATLVAAGSGVAYAKTQAASWLRPTAAAALLALPIGLAWITVALMASSS